MHGARRNQERSSGLKRDRRLACLLDQKRAFDDVANLFTGNACACRAWRAGRIRRPPTPPHDPAVLRYRPAARTVRLNGGCCAATMPVNATDDRRSRRQLSCDLSRSARAGYSRRGSESSDRASCCAHSGQSAAGVVLRRAVVGERDVRHAEIDDRLAAVVDLRRSRRRCRPLPVTSAAQRANVSPVFRTSSASRTRLPSSSRR